MSQAERRELASLLADLDKPAPGERAPGGATVGEPDPGRADLFHYDPSLRRERRLALLIAADCAGRTRQSA